jgi:hypothetical protein
MVYIIQANFYRQKKKKPKKNHKTKSKIYCIGIWIVHYYSEYFVIYFQK